MSAVDRAEKEALAAREAVAQATLRMNAITAGERDPGADLEGGSATCRETPKAASSGGNGNGNGDDEKEEKEDKMIEIVDSPALKVLSVLLNPSTMVLALYLSSVGWSKVLWLQKFFKIFGKGTLVKKKGEEEKVEDAIERGAGRGPRIPLALPLEALLLLE